MGRAGRLAAGLALLGSLCACSPLYVLQSAAGHADLLLRRRSIERALKDPRLPPDLRAKLDTADSARRFAFESLGLKKSRDFTTYALIDRSAVTYLVSGSPRTKLQAYEWWFPIAGRFPYKGYFVKARALAERDRLETKGFDASVSGAAAYKTPLPFTDPLPSSALDFSTGSLAALLIHELTHGTVYFKNHSDFDEALAQFAGEQGARRYLAARFGAESPELAAYLKELEGDAAADGVFSRLREKLLALYGGPAPDAEKLEARRPLFAAAQAELEALGFHYKVLNNSVVVAHEVYHSDLPFAALLERCGGDFPKFVAALKTLDPQDPAGALRRQVAH